MSTTRKLKVAFGQPGKKNLSVVTNEDLTWPDLVARFENPARDDHTLAEYLAMSVEEQRNWKNKGYFVGGQFKDGKRRKVNLECRSVVTLDIDDNCDTGDISSLSRSSSRSPNSTSRPASKVVC